MRFMLMLKGDPPADSQPSAEIIDAMVTFNQELQKAGVLLAAEGLHPSATGSKIVFSGGGKRAVIDGPFAESKELIAGFYLIQVRSKEEALEWAARCPIEVALPPGVEGEIEVRQVAEVEDLTEATEEHRATDSLRDGGYGRA